MSAVFQERNTGAVSFRTYLYYMASSGGCMAVFLITSSLMSEVSNTASVFWLAEWTKQSRQVTQSGKGEVDVWYYVQWYSMLAMLTCILILTRSYFIAVVRCSPNLPSYLPCFYSRLV